MCGTEIRTSGDIPNENEWKLFSDVEFDQYSGQVDVEKLYLAGTIAFRCPVSDHLWIYWDGFDKTPQLYEPIPGGEGGRQAP
ncbi:hypothetical protein [Mycolicibacterium stellerae]|uniref:hypothetical protein n=1 Tax=Mycolicibacterium stellerae TaxID=2358193 RepID=UPI0013DDA17D|nr:hypothetical protein [Mycolicibacterium stellerae]